ncbi:hypothetical protein FJV46_00355 [Arthrobacter agilis]|uniref:hypothetical protein n=1 Tax=Arthrobacter agilis TaxID=37921 RepID=UPI000B359AAF|nr:hypothetical protein [Arthrobacter agilis]OUM40366.1 hypothetical protein B8W74_12585 [Arthrobacter agilis]PPB44980.1 hypothetical protein CI784_12605 [Arthrobacter agilis]TPV27682.1 hypothetical protein FJV46_00355 [Arthrobacter agilis]WDF34397.1 hypothetical protein PTW37_05645 [Arthrobacter agilis]VDR31680.1 Uncharacterised protein [Arthrobacter agilis]
MDPFFLIGTLVCAVSALLCIGAALLRQPPNDITILSVAAVELFLLVYGVGAVIRQLTFEPVLGEAWEFWGYLLTALFVPIGAFWWSIVEKTRWSNFVLAAAGLTVFVMLFRMEQIWDGVAGL